MPSKNPNIHPVAQPKPINLDDHRTDAEIEAADEVERMKVERDALTKQIRAASKKASPAKPTLSLDEVEKRQTEHLAIYLVDTFTSFAKARVQAGASPEGAVVRVLAMYQAPVLQALTTCLESGEPIADVTARMLGRTRGHRTKAE